MKKYQGVKENIELVSGNLYPASSYWRGKICFDMFSFLSMFLTVNALTEVCCMITFLFNNLLGSQGLESIQSSLLGNQSPLLEWPGETLSLEHGSFSPFGAISGAGLGQRHPKLLFHVGCSFLTFLPHM